MHRIYVFTLVGLLLMSACQKIVLDENEWQSDWLLPILKAKLTMAQLKEVKKQTISYSIPATDLGFTENVAIDVPAVSITNLGPYIQPLSDWVQSVTIDTLAIRIDINNVFPIAIGAGTQLTVRNSADTMITSNIVTCLTIPADILPGQRFESSIQVSKSTLEDNLYLFVDVLNTPGGTQVSFSTSPTLINISLEVIDLSKIRIYPSKEYTNKDTFKIDFSNQYTNIDSMANGNVTVSLENGLPIQTQVQLYFLDATKSTVIDSMFVSSFEVQAGITDLNGFTSQSSTSSSTITLSAEKISRIRQARYAAVQYALSTPPNNGNSILIDKTAYLELFISGDLKFHITAIK